MYALKKQDRPRTAEEVVNSNVMKYSHYTRVGNWRELAMSSEEKIKNYAQIIRRGETLQQTKLVDFNKEVNEITITPDKPNITSGDKIYIYNAHVTVPDATRRKTEDEITENDLEMQKTNLEFRNTNGITLSVAFNFKDYEITSKVLPGMLVTGVTILIPTVRNTFIIKKIKGSQLDSDIIHYGDQITLSPLDTYNNGEYFVSCLPQHHLAATIGLAEKVQLRITSNFNMYCRWRLLNTVPKYRENGGDAPANQDLIIQHVATNHTLCALDTWSHMMFYKECEVTVERREDQYLFPKKTNCWRICNQAQPGRIHKYATHQSANKNSLANID